MISNEAFRNIIAENLLGGKYHIYSDVGEFVAGYRSRNTLTFTPCGIYRQGNVVITPVKGLMIAQMTSEVEIAAEEFNLGEIRNDVDTMAQANSGNTFEVQDGDRTYQVTTLISTAMVGSKRDAPDNSGLCYPVRFTVSFTIIENGIAASDVELIIDGYPVFFTDLQVTRSRITDLYCTDDNGTMKGIVVQGGMSIDLTAPILNSTLGNMFADATFTNETNKAHLVFIKIGEHVYGYIAVFGNMAATIRPMQNVGANVSLVEAHPDLITFDEATGWNTANVASNTSAYGLAPAEGKTIYVLWGDGTCDILTKSTTHRFVTAGKHTVRWIER